MKITHQFEFQTKKEFFVNLVADVAIIISGVYVIGAFDMNALWLLFVGSLAASYKIELK